MEPAAQVEGGVPGMGVLIDNRPRRARAGVARKRAAPSPWLSVGGNQQRCALLYYTVRAPRGWDRILLIFSKDFGSSTMRFFLFE